MKTNETVAKLNDLRERFIFQGGSQFATDLAAHLLEQEQRIETQSWEIYALKMHRQRILQLITEIQPHWEALLRGRVFTAETAGAVGALSNQIESWVRFFEALMEERK
jgi:hypothetical protein